MIYCVTQHGRLTGDTGGPGAQDVHGRARSRTRGGEDPGPMREGGRRQGGRRLWDMDSSHSADCREKGEEGGEKA